MNIYKSVFCALALIFSLTLGVFASCSLDLESGYVSAGYNDVRIPGNTGTGISLTKDLSVDSKQYFRLRTTKGLGNDRYISFLVAPLSLDASGTLAGEANYNGDTFAAGSKMTGRYRFDSYRATYYKEYNTGKRFQCKVGFTAKIRDAAILLSDGVTESEKKNTGFVPLLHFGIAYDLTEKMVMVLDGDAIAGGPGRAEDVLFAIKYRSGKNHSFRLGYRVVEGGADTKEAYSFALLNYISVAAGINF